MRRIQSILNTRIPATEHNTRRAQHMSFAWRRHHGDRSDFIADM